MSRTAGATTTLNYPTAAAGLSTLNVFSGAGGETVNVQASRPASPRHVDTGSVSGSTTNVGLGGSLAAILGPVFVQSTGGTNTLAIDDSAEAAGQDLHHRGIAGHRHVVPRLHRFLRRRHHHAGPDQCRARRHVQLHRPGSVGRHDLQLLRRRRRRPEHAQRELQRAAAQLHRRRGRSGSAPAIRSSITSISRPINVTKPAIPPVGTGVTINATEGQALNNVVVATFTESDLGNATADFTASINWGDSDATSAGTIQANGGPNGYNILGSHTYAATGTYHRQRHADRPGEHGNHRRRGHDDQCDLDRAGHLDSQPDRVLGQRRRRAADGPGRDRSAGSGGRRSESGRGRRCAGRDLHGHRHARRAAGLHGHDRLGRRHDAHRRHADHLAGHAQRRRLQRLRQPHLRQDRHYPVTVTITKTASGATAIASGQAVIAATPRLTPGTATALSAQHRRARSPAGSVVGTFTDANTTDAGQRLHRDDRLGRRVADQHRHGRRRHARGHLQRRGDSHLRQGAGSLHADDRGHTTPAARRSR